MTTFRIDTTCVWTKEPGNFITAERLQLRGREVDRLECNSSAGMREENGSALGPFDSDGGFFSARRLVKVRKTLFMFRKSGKDTGRENQNRRNSTMKVVDDDSFLSFQLDSANIRWGCSLM